MNHSNHLINEPSPYLQQHVHNPVDWYPWNKEALEKARRENKPILLSIGYAACHWCHRMAHESFEDEETAQLMNSLFVNIKVDREERPDLDKIYQMAHYLLTQSQGGWPLTLFLNPQDLIPFFSGTYFPLEPRYQLPAFKEVLKTIADIYQQHPDQIKQQNSQLLNILSPVQQTSVPAVTLDAKPFASAMQFLEKKFDAKNGGFGKAPKFPHPPILEFLLSENSPMATLSLTKMAEGGIYDQIQGGFFRYAVDEAWQIPHFEKMLYDNAQLLLIYSIAAQQNNDRYFNHIAHETADWIMNVMQSPQGGYYSTLDADSEGQEGKFYVWNKFEIEESLTNEEAEFADLYFGLAGPPNFGKFWHLHVANSLETVALQLKMSYENAEALLVTVKQKLLAARSKRIFPHQDQKILTSWNGLMIKGMALAGEYLQQPRYFVSAEKALNFLMKSVWVPALDRVKQDEYPLPLLACYKDGTAYLPAYLDDYAFLLDAVLTMHQIAPTEKWLEFAKALADTLLNHFYDREHGGFFFTSDLQEKILYRPKTLQDEAIPSGNAVACRALLKLGVDLEEERYFQVVEKTLQAAWPMLTQFPSEHCTFLLALQDFLRD